ncbi:insecticidal delta-endotoxin Cry8Ea1 family protein [Enterococcus casseliflavus]|uniref:insecticidal delta-endotoxin Cry8Ea1 family protein n=1 Tax=Enterococcus casseliflavus TaxID=37734 RepID=UPI00232E6121|nr:insecticidal delta-endotoxin Cry8Ea1 family protein [Enterococcus casseliflavus]MDB1689842.1 insecticidal delta-endotoxin Cry8Ea1 family protein [Enterococcus casseliflavus]
MKTTIQDLRDDARILGPANAKRKISEVKTIMRHHTSAVNNIISIAQGIGTDAINEKVEQYHEVIFSDGTVKWCYFDDDVLSIDGQINKTAYNICLVDDGFYSEEQEKAFNERVVNAMERFCLTSSDILEVNRFTKKTSKFLLKNLDSNQVATQKDNNVVYNNVFTKKNSKNASSIILDIVTEIGWAVANKLPGGSILTGAADLFLSLFSSNENVWEEFIKHVEGLINRKLSEFVKASALSELDGIGRVYQSYVRAYEIWYQNKTEQNATNLRTQFIATETYIRGRIQPAFNVRNFEVNLLTLYTQASNIHLSILSDVVELGNLWGFSSATINQYYESLENKINEYTNHCYKTYQDGLESMLGTRFVDWCNYNKYRREMTMAVLDISATFTNYDSRLYPVKTKTQLTRETHSDFPLSRPDLVVQHNSLPSFAEAESTLIKPPGLFGYIDYLEIHTSTFANRQYWSGHLLRKSPSHGTNSPLITYGRNGGSIRPIRVDIGGNFPVIRTRTNNTDIRGNNLLSIDGATFSIIDRDSIYMNNNSNIDSLELFPKNKNENGNNTLGYSHFLSDITFLELYRTNQVIAGALQSWNHTTSDLNNTLDVTAITQIPWIKARTLGENTRIISSKGLLGNHLMINMGSSNNNSLGELVVRSGFSSSRLRNFYIRIRYASPRQVRGQLLFNNNTLENRLTFRSTFSSSLDWEDALESVNYLRFTDLIGPIALPVGMNATSRFNLNVSRVYIDRIEFIPEDLVDKL